MKYDLVQCQYVDTMSLQAVLDEFVNAGEYCNALWRAAEIGIDKWKTECDKNAYDRNRELIFAFTVNGEIVGISRVTPKPKHVENGMVGYYILPSKRKRKYAPVMLRMVEDECAAKGISNLTAVVDVENTASVKALFSAGWKRSGNLYQWNHGRTAIEFIPKACGSL